MNSSQKLELRMEAKETRLNPEKVTLSEGRIVRNAEKTGDDKAAVGGSWKGFWQFLLLMIFQQNVLFVAKS